MDILPFIALAPFPVLMVVGGLHDLTTMRIPNWISLALLAAFFPAALLLGVAPLDVAAHVGVGVAALLEAATPSRLDGRTPWTLRTDIRPGHFPPLPLSENSTASFIEDGIGRVSMLYASLLLAPALVAATGAPLAMPPP